VPVLITANGWEINIRKATAVKSNDTSAGKVKAHQLQAAFRI
jgi:hypothetical protein